MSALCTAVYATERAAISSAQRTAFHTANYGADFTTVCAAVEPTELKTYCAALRAAVSAAFHATK